MEFGEDAEAGLWQSQTHLGSLGASQHGVYGRIPGRQAIRLGSAAQRAGFGLEPFRWRAATGAPRQARIPILLTMRACASG